MHREKTKKVNREKSRQVSTWGTFKIQRNHVHKELVSNSQ